MAQIQGGEGGAKRQGKEDGGKILSPWPYVHFSSRGFGFAGKRARVRGVMAIPDMGANWGVPGVLAPPPRHTSTCAPRFFEGHQRAPSPQLRRAGTAVATPGRFLGLIIREDEVREAADALGVLL